jgi:hypothetical protein
VPDKFCVCPISFACADKFQFSCTAFKIIQMIENDLEL